MNLESFLKEIKQNWMFAAVLSIAVGLVLLLFPGITIQVVCYLLGCLVIIFGASRIIRYFKQDPAYHEVFQGDLMTGLFGAVIGLFMILKAEIVVSLVPIVFGVVLLTSGIGNVQRTIDARRAGYPRWGVLLALALLTIVLSLLLLINPFGSMQVAVAVIGASLIYEGVSDIVFMLLLGKRIEEWKNAAR